MTKWEKDKNSRGYDAINAALLTKVQKGKVKGNGYDK